MKMSIYQPPRNVADAGGGSVYVGEPGATDPDYGPNRIQEGRNAERAARIAALRANPMFRKSTTPIQFKEGYNPNMQNMMMGLFDQSEALKSNTQLAPMFRPTRSY